MIKLLNLITENITDHAVKQINDRMRKIGYSKEKRKKVTDKALEYTKKSKVRSEAVRMFTIPNIYGIPWSNESNGNEVWAIIRNNTLITVMLRRNTQPSTPQSLRVDKVTISDEKL